MRKTHTAHPSSPRKIQRVEQRQDELASCGELCRMECPDLATAGAEHTRCQRQLCIVGEDQYIAYLPYIGNKRLTESSFHMLA